MAITKEIYWARRAQCDKGKHRLRDNAFGVTWCVTCGFLSSKPSGISLTNEDRIITNDFMDIDNTHSIVDESDNKDKPE